MISLIFVFVLSFIIGSIPTAYIFGKLFKGIDIREYGSGNVGATNALRILGTSIGIFVLVFDISKGVISTVLIPSINPFKELYISSELIRCVSGISAILGHIFSPFLNFKGGKGVATGFGVFLGIDIFSTLIAFSVFLMAFSIMRYVSVGSIILFISLPFCFLILSKPSIYLYFSILVATIVFLTHIPNIKKLIKGEENKFSWR